MADVNHSPGETMLASTRKGLFVLARSDADWAVERVAFLGDNVTLTAVDPRDGGWYAALDLGHFGCKLHRSTDHGRTWSELPVPTYPEGAMIVPGDGKAGTPATLKLIWSLEAGGADQPGRLWAGTTPGGLFRSDDHGQSWQLVHGLWDQAARTKWFGGGFDTPGIHSISLDPRDPKRLHVAVSCGGVWCSDDDGETWVLRCSGMSAAYMPPDRRDDPSIQDPHRLVRSPTRPDSLWVQHHNGIYHSDDGGQSWHELTVEPSTFGFAVAVHPTDPDRVWFVPAVKDETRVPVNGALCVTHTADGGKTFTAQRTGLPQSHAYDLVYRHALAIDGSGDRLAFGSTTGSLWVTEDQGQRWRAVSHHLPPIHAVCFA